MPIPPTFHGDETGLLKDVHYDGQGVGKAVASFASQSRESAVDKLCVLGVHQVAIGTRSGEIRSWDGKELNHLAKAVDGQRIRGLCGTNDRLIACGENGKIEVRVWPSGELSGGFKVDSAVDFGRLCPSDGKRLAVGGKNHDLRIWDVETMETVFRAKNLPHDSLDMPVPVWITDACWTPNGTIMTSTAYNQIRAYDLRQRRPIKDVSLKQKDDEHNHHLNCIVATPEDHTAVVGDNFGQVSIVDVMRTGRLISGFKGPRGSVRSLAMHPETRTLACGGLDRYVRVFNLDSHRQIGKFYAKQQVNAVTFGAVPFELGREDNAADGESSDLDWGQDFSDEDEGRLLHAGDDDDEGEDDKEIDEQVTSRTKSTKEQPKKPRDYPVSKKAKKW